MSCLQRQKLQHIKVKQGFEQLGIPFSSQAATEGVQLAACSRLGKALAHMLIL